MRKPGGVIIGVDILRYLSALMVALFHLGYLINQPGSTAARIAGGTHFTFPWPSDTFGVGRIGVQIFFVISGFVIAYTARKSDTLSFVQSRVLRLAPAAWICASVTLAVAFMIDMRGPAALGKAWVRSVAFLPFGEYIDGAYWTLAIECAFYALVLTMIATRMLKHLEKLFLLIACISTIFCLTVLVVRPELNHLVGDRYLQLALIVHGCEFAVGVFLWGLLFQGSSPLRIVGLVVGLVGGSIEVWHWVPTPGDGPLAAALWLASVVAITCSVIFNERLKHKLVEKGVTFARNMGLATYPLYLLHDLVGAALMKNLAIIGVPDGAGLAIALIVVSAAAYLIAVYLEPIIRAGLRSSFGVVGRFRQAWT
jgi:peptidoglycan/LPS O-acetylase OafA/YrhL